MATSHRQRLLIALGAVMTAVALSVAGLQTDAGFTRTITNTGDTASSTTRLGTCSNAMSRDNALWAFLLRDTGTNPPAANLTAPGAPGSYQNSGTLFPNNITHQTGQSGCTRDPAGYVSVLGNADSNTGNAGWVNGPTAGLPANSLGAGFTAEVWFRTPTTLGGSILSLGDTNFVATTLVATPITLSGRKDHQIFMLANGRLSFALYKGGANLQVTSTASFNDNVWHHAVATVSPTAGSALYVDGALIGTSPTATSGDIDGIVSYLRVGYESLVGWTGAPTRYAWTGDLAHAAIYTYPFTATQVLTHYRAGLA